MVTSVSFFQAYQTPKTSYSGVRPPNNSSGSELLTYNTQSFVPPSKPFSTRSYFTDLLAQLSRQTTILACFLPQKRRNTRGELVQLSADQVYELALADIRRRFDGTDLNTAVIGTLNTLRQYTNQVEQSRNPAGDNKFLNQCNRRGGEASFFELTDNGDGVQI